MDDDGDDNTVLYHFDNQVNFSEFALMNDEERIFFAGGEEKTEKSNVVVEGEVEKEHAKEDLNDDKEATDGEGSQEEDPNEEVNEHVENKDVRNEPFVTKEILEETMVDEQDIKENNVNKELFNKEVTGEETGVQNRVNEKEHVKDVADVGPNSNKEVIDEEEWKQEDPNDDVNVWNEQGTTVENAFENLVKVQDIEDEVIGRENGVQKMVNEPKSGENGVQKMVNEPKSKEENANELVIEGSMKKELRTEGKVNCMFKSNNTSSKMASKPRKRKKTSNKNINLVGVDEVTHGGEEQDKLIEETDMINAAEEMKEKVEREKSKDILTNKEDTIDEAGNGGRSNKQVIHRNDTKKEVSTFKQTNANPKYELDTLMKKGKGWRGKNRTMKIANEIHGGGENRKEYDMITKSEGMKEQFNKEKSKDEVPEEDGETEEVNRGDITDEVFINGKDQKEELKNVKPAKSNSKVKVDMLRKRGRKMKKGFKVIDEVTKKESNDEGLPEKRAKATMGGMIFMCSSKTKKDCYRYNVLGFPAGKKDTVLQITEGMKLFLFDFDVKLLYGIYKAAGPGGYNIEPEAFNSRFPSQVRFNIYEDYSPLPENIFREAIKENYYQKKFNCQLTFEQVKRLCQLFRAKCNDSKSAKLHRGSRPGTDTKRDRNGGRAETHKIVEEARSRKRRRRQLERHFAFDRDKSKRQRKDHRVHEREAYPSRLPPIPVHTSLNLPSAHAMARPQRAYERISGRNAYERDPLIEHWDRGEINLELRHREQIPHARDPIRALHNGDFLDSEVRHPQDIEDRDPYDLHRNPPLYRHLSYTAARPSDYRFPAESVYHSDLPVDYWPHQPVYRY